MFGMGTTELMIVAVIALLLFGNRLPQAMRGLGLGMKEFRDGMNGIEKEVKEAT
jgi:sec-independent protein translocase protein TatA